MKNHLSPQHVEHKTRPQHNALGNPCFIIENVHTFGGLNRLMGFTPSHPDNNCILNGCTDLLPRTNKRHYQSSINMDCATQWSMNNKINMDSTLSKSMNDNINMDSPTTASANDTKSMDSTTAGSMNVKKTWKVQQQSQ
jgi:hypothetical protein